MRRWLANNKIVAEGLTWDLDVLREKIYNKIAIQRRLKARLETLNEIMYNSTLQNEYSERRVNYIEEFFKDEKKAEEVIRNRITELFRKRMDQRVEELRGTAQCFGLESKSKLFVELRDLLARNRLTEVVGE